MYLKYWKNMLVALVMSTLLSLLVYSYLNYTWGTLLVSPLVGFITAYSTMWIQDKLGLMHP
jgi:hypothetical protein